LSVVLAHQPHFADQPAGIQVFWDTRCTRTGSAISWPSPMAE